MAAQTEEELPACPVETTLTLIGDKWKVLILRDLMPGTKRFGELKKSIGGVSPKGTDRAASCYGKKRTGHTHRIPGSSTESGILSDRTGKKSETDPRRHAKLGRRVQGGEKTQQLNPPIKTLPHSNGMQKHSARMRQYSYSGNRSLIERNPCLDLTSSLTVSVQSQTPIPPGGSLPPLQDLPPSLPPGQPLLSHLGSRT